MNFDYYPQLIEQGNIKLAILSYADLHLKVNSWLNAKNLDEIILLCDTSVKKPFIYMKTSLPQYRNLNSELNEINIPHYYLHPVIEHSTLQNIYFYKKWSFPDFLMSLEDKKYYQHFLVSKLEEQLSCKVQNSDTLTKI